eukprot:gb/GFBE01077356.1/.p1 GENE.gb/GFBE01077356.1/~~gb/GFBE01077356.1/.p1  ORF type:complete len:327 (+),score=64.69 gb/GFBE01077356.1/:1-981(+)
MAHAALEHWFLDHGGAKAPGVVVRASTLGGNGVFLDGSDALPAGAEVMSLPVASCPSSLQEGVAELPVNSLFRLAELLCTELLKGPSSQWAPWFASLPAACGNWPEWRDAELLSARKGPPHFFKAAVNWAQKLPAWYQEVSKLLPSSCIATLDDKAPFRRAMALLFSRRFGIRVGESKITLCFPLGDMMNYAVSAANVEVHYEESTARIKFVAKREIMPGEELLFCYGDYDSTEVCIFYGFALESNLCEPVQLGDGTKLEVTEEHPGVAAEALERTLAALPPAAEDEEMAVGTASSLGCRAIARWRLNYRSLLRHELAKVMDQQPK